MWLKQLNQGWNKTKSFLSHGYSRLGKFASEADSLFRVGRKLFNLAAPALEDIGAGEAVKHGVRALGQYDDLRGKVMDVDAKVRGHAGRFADADIFS